jgi:serine/threonine-protein kinase RsbT
VSSDEVRVRILSDDDIVTARQEGRRLSAGLGFSSTDLTLIATAISEIARNIRLFAGEGNVQIKRVEDAGREGIVVVARDKGPGISDVERATRRGEASGSGCPAPGGSWMSSTSDPSPAAG